MNTKSWLCETHSHVHVLSATKNILIHSCYKGTCGGVMFKHMALVPDAGTVAACLSPDTNKRRLSDVETLTAKLVTDVCQWLSTASVQLNLVVSNVSMLKL